MSHAVTSQYLTQSASQETNEISYIRPPIEKQNTSDVLEYYSSADASVGYSAADFANSRAAHRRPATAPSRSSNENAATHSTSNEEHGGPMQSNIGSIRLVPPNPNKDSTRRPSLHHADSINVVMNNRRVAIVERDASLPQMSPNANSSVSATGQEVSPTSIRVDRSRLALVSPPDTAPSSHAIHSSPPSAAAFALSKSSRSKYAEARASTVSPNSNSPSSQSNVTSTGRGHARSSSDNTFPFTSANFKTTGGSGSANPLSGSSHTAGTTRNVSDRSGQHNRERSTSSESDYGDMQIDSKYNNPQIPKSSVLLSRRPPASETTGGMHIPLPTAPRYFGSSAGTTPMLTPAIGDGKPIDLKVAAPVVVDIRSDLADLWLAATPDADREPGSSAGSPITAITTTTDSSSMPTSFSPTSSRQSSVTSPRQPFVRDHTSDVAHGAMQIPPSRIDINSLSPSPLPVCPPRPQRQPSPAKSMNGQIREGHDRASSSTIGPEEHLKAKGSPHSAVNAALVEDPDAKYSLATLSDDESDSDYSNNHSSRHGRSRSPTNPSSLVKNGSIHVREGAFPPQSVFLEHVKVDIDADPDMKTPTAKRNLEGMFQQAHGQPVPHSSLDANEIAFRKSFDTNEVDSILSSSYQSGSKLSHGGASGELPARRSRHNTPGSTEEDVETVSLIQSSSMMPVPPSKDPEDVFRRYIKSGKKLGGEEAQSLTLQPNSSTESSTPQRQYAHTHLGHGPPPSGRTPPSKAPSAFKAKGPLVTSQSLRRTRKRKPINKPRSMWPSAMSFADVLSEQTALARARGYAMKLNELATEDCGLVDWIDSVISKTQPIVMTTEGPVAVGQNHKRFVSGSSAQSETTFPIRPDAYKAIDITPASGEFASSEVPSTIPYQSLARQHNTGSRPLIPPIPPAKTSIGSVVSGSATFLATLGRKASMRTRGTQSATESREREPRSAPRKLVSTRSPALRSNGTPPLPSTPVSAAPALPSAPTIPGGPRAQRPKRASTMVAAGTKPIISAPIPIPPHSRSDPIPPPPPMAPEPLTHETGPGEASWSTKPLPLNLTKDVPRAPEGPRPPSKITRTPSFPGPGSTRVSTNGNLRSTVSFRPIPSPLGMASTGSSSKVTQSDVGIGARRQDRPMDSREFDRQLNKLCDVLPHVSRDTLAIYLSRADGQNMVAIGRYLEDERQGTILQS